MAPHVYVSRRCVGVVTLDVLFLLFVNLGGRKLIQEERRSLPSLPAQYCKFLQLCTECPKIMFIVLRYITNKHIIYNCFEFVGMHR